MRIAIAAEVLVQSKNLLWLKDSLDYALMMLTLYTNLFLADCYV